MNESAEAQPSDRCPRCGGGFHCGINETKPCACAGVRLDAGLLQRLRQLHGDRCLCLRCLQALADGAAP